MSQSQIQNRKRLRPESESHRIGDWRLTRLLGQGALTRVYQAVPADRDGEWPADYVVKTVAPGAPNTLALELLRGEAEACRSTSNAHLPALLEASLGGELPYLLFPYLAGGSLAERLARYGTAPPVLTFWMLRQALSAVAALHTGGWAHGDIKPANILVGEDMHTTLIDLGFAQRLEPGSDPQERSALRMATPGYAAPEIQRGDSATAASDMYSVGVTLFESLAGRRPFVADDPEALREAHCFAAIPDIRTMRPHLPHETQTLIRRLLAKDPAERPTLFDAERAVMKLEIECFDNRGVA